MPIIPDKVEVTISPIRVISTILTLIAFGMLFFTAGDWIGRADAAHAITTEHKEELPKLQQSSKDHHETISKLTDISTKLANQQEILVRQQELERKMWGEDYEKKIHEILSTD